MTAAKKKKAPAATRATVRAAVRAHPWLTWGTLASIVAVAAGAGSFILWVTGQFQTTDAARSHATRDEQRYAWIVYGQSKTNVLLLRNRLNDCNAKPIVTRAERPACDQYKQEYEEEARKAQDLYRDAMRAGKETTP